MSKLQTYDIKGERIAARSLEAARMAHREILKAKLSTRQDKLKHDAHLARTQPYGGDA